MQFCIIKCYSCLLAYSNILISYGISNISDIIHLSIPIDINININRNYYVAFIFFIICPNFVCIKVHFLYSFFEYPINYIVIYTTVTQGYYIT